MPKLDCNCTTSLLFAEEVDPETLPYFTTMLTFCPLHKAAPELLECLEELANLIDDIVSGIYTPDRFTTQPAHTLIAYLKTRGNNDPH